MIKENLRYLLFQRGECFEKIKTSLVVIKTVPLMASLKTFQRYLFNGKEKSVFTEQKRCHIKTKYSVRYEP